MLASDEVRRRAEVRDCPVVGGRAGVLGEAAVVADRKAELEPWNLIEAPWSPGVKSSFSSPSRCCLSYGTSTVPSGWTTTLEKV